MPKFKPNPDIAQQKQTEALALLEQGIENLATDDNWLQYLKTQSRFHSYSFRNVVMILSQCPDAKQVAGFRAWQAMNRQVRKGEKGLLILAPIIRKVEDDNGDTLRALKGFKTTSVFDISQTDGEDLPEICTALYGDDAGLLNQLRDYAASLNIPVRFEGCLGANGLCRWLADGRIEISVEPNLSLLHQCKTLAHELGHALMHSEAEYRRHSMKSQRELEAESVAFTVLHRFGLDSGNYSFAYLMNWSGGAEEAIAQLKESGRRIQDAAHQIIEEVEAQTQAIEPERELMAV